MSHGDIGAGDDADWKIQDRGAKESRRRREVINQLQDVCSDAIGERRDDAHDSRLLEFHMLCLSSGAC